MSMAIAHFAVGAMATALLLALVAPRLLRSPTVLVVGGIWGMLPDVHWVLPAGSALVRSFHMTAWANVFWFHHYLDGADPGDSPAFAAGLVVLLVVVLAFCELLTRTGTAPTAASPVESGHE
jgi:predicted membrane channel-forming protein YqfA (hemolysin III family)